MHDFWYEPLARTLALNDRTGGITLTTLADAGRFLLDRSESLMQPAELIDAIDLVLEAAKSGEADDIEAATVQLESVFSAQRTR
ncbi:hypothetical protein ABLE91_16970 [Aquabacter sp. CN5-332]|uniref:hypothetical protein n=1 Tax=Aquabacter sp. CN5-332 TaxID=3156608 RepID=UPI0032B4FA7F